MTDDKLNEAPEVEETEEVEAEDQKGQRKAAESPQQLEEEGEIAADYLEELLDIYDLDGDIEIDVRQGRAYLEITANDESNLKLISDPETVEALVLIFAPLVLGIHDCFGDLLGTCLVASHFNLRTDIGDQRHLRDLSCER